MKPRDLIRVCATLVGSAFLSLYVYTSSLAGGFSPSQMGMNNLLFASLLYGLSLPITWAVGLMMIPSGVAQNPARPRGSRTLTPTEGSRPTIQSPIRRNRKSIDGQAQASEKASSSRALVKAVSQKTSLQCELRAGLEAFSLELASRRIENPVEIEGKAEVASHKSEDAYECRGCGLKFSDTATISAHDEETGHMKYRNQTIVIKSRPIHDSAYRVLSGF